jgi:hypothetical protein
LGQWKWASWVPDALVINLGTNDGHNALTPAYTEIYTKLVMASLDEGISPSPSTFVGRRPLGNCGALTNNSAPSSQAAAKNYGPNLNVFMACGPMSEVYCSPIGVRLSLVNPLSHTKFDWH